MLVKLKFTQRELEKLLSWASAISKNYLYNKHDAKLALKIKLMYKDECHKNYLKRKYANIKNS